MRRRCATAMLLAVALAIQGASHMSAQGHAPAGIVNFTRVDATVACGGATEPSAMAALAAEGFKTVINIRLAAEPGVADEEAVVTKAGLAYLHVPMDPLAPAAATADHILRLLADRSLHPIYLHCASANRVGAVWAIKRVVQDGWTRERAVDEGRAIGMKSPVMLEFVHQYLDERP